MKNNIIYLDYNSTTPIDKEVLKEVVFVYENHFANPISSTHLPGWIANGLLKHYRKKVANLIEAESSSIIFTSGATESNNTILHGVAKYFNCNDIHFIVSTIEHKSILNCCEVLKKIEGVDITYVPVNSSGEVNISLVKKAIRSNTVLISIMAANNETGILQPIDEIAKIAQEKNVLFHSDGAQFIGKIPFSVKNNPIDFMSFSSHKFYGPKGVGAIYARNPIILKKFPLISGGGQESGVRSGTVNLPNIAGMAKACEIANKQLEHEAIKFKRMKKEFIKELRSKVQENIGVYGDEVNTLPSTVNFYIPGVGSKEILGIVKDSLAISVGSACTSRNQTSSHVLKAMGISDEQISSSFRLSFGRFTTNEELSKAVVCFSRAFKKINTFSNFSNI